VAGKQWTGFANAEEDFADQAVGQTIQPYRIEDEARKLPGTQFKVAPPFTAFAIQDGNLVTGQQQNSGAAAAQLVVQLLNA
jgi:putative intracellular protease/amidase